MFFKRSSIHSWIPSRTLAYTAFSMTVGSAFQHGYYTSILNNPHEELKQWIYNFFVSYGLVEHAESLLFVRLFWALEASVYFFGGVFGSIIAGSTIDKYDRRNVILINCATIIIPVIILTLTYITGVSLLILLARFVLGINAGIFSCAVPIYLAEISPTRIRGMVCSLYSVFYAFGVFSAFFIGHSRILGGTAWIIMMMVPIAPLAVQMILMRYCPVSPRYLLIKKGKYDEALKILMWLRRTEQIDALEKELEEISNELEDYFLYRAIRDVQWTQLFTMHYMRKPMLISIMLMCAQQLCGCIVFLLYSAAMFQRVGLTDEFADTATLIMGGLFLIMSILSMILIDIAGRRMLMIYGYIGTFIFGLVHYLTYLYNKEKQGCVGAVATLFVYFYMIHYALGPNSVPLFIVSEMFNQASRPKAVSLAVCCNWLLNNVIAISFWPIVISIRAHVFLIYLAFQVFFFYFIVKYVPETMNKTISEVTELYK